jgi:hypothetical protein
MDVQRVGRNLGDRTTASVTQALRSSVLDYQLAVIEYLDEVACAYSQGKDGLGKIQALGHWAEFTDSPGGAHAMESLHRALMGYWGLLALRTAGLAPGKNSEARKAWAQFCEGSRSLQQLVEAYLDSCPVSNVQGPDDMTPVEVPGVGA